MRIAKPLRVFLNLSLMGATSGAVAGLLRPHIHGYAIVVAAVALVPAWILWGALVDHVDLWLRRRTRDPIWLMTHEGRAWLSSPEGVAWSKGRGVKAPPIVPSQTESSRAQAGGDVDDA